MRGWLIAAAWLIFICYDVSAQRSEIGFGLGTFNYTGDLSRKYNFLNSKPAATVFYRSNLSNVVSFRAGFKYIVNPKWYVALEFGMRKTFFDYLDNISVADPRDKNNRQYGNPFDNDHYYFLGLSVTRTFYDIPCPTNPYK